MNKKVMVVFSDPLYASDWQPFPPIGAVGETVSEIDSFGEYDVLFPEYPCKTVGDPTWITHKRMIVFIDDSRVSELAEIAERI